MLPNYIGEGREQLEASARAGCQSALLGERAVLCRVLGKYIMYADPSDVGLTPHLCLDGYWESWVTVALARLLRPGWHCVDVGANQGYFTMLMADAVGPEGRVLAVEPNPRLTSLLELSAEVNGFAERTRVLARAAFDADAERLRLAVPRGRWMDATLCREPAPGEEAVEVESATLDTLTADWPRVDLVKIDAEGAEEAIWRGMRRTLERHREIRVVMELRCSRYEDPRRFVRQILDAGFPLRHVAYDGELHDATEEQVLHERPDEDWMLYLCRY